MKANQQSAKQNNALELLISKLQVKRDLFPISGTKTNRLIRGVYVDSIIIAKEILAEQSKTSEKVKSGEWISVDEKAPSGIFLLVCHNKDNWHSIAKLVHNLWYDDDSIKTVIGPTHWMHLPNPHDNA